MRLGDGPMKKAPIRCLAVPVLPVQFNAVESERDTDEQEKVIHRSSGGRL